MTTPPQTWRIVGDRAVDYGSFIPCSDPARQAALLQRMIDGPTEEERMALVESRLKREQDEAVQRRLRKIRHMALVSVHEGILRRLLEEHAPHEEVHEFHGTVHEVCHGCPESHDGELGSYYQSWPCPTWQTISDSTR